MEHCRESWGAQPQITDKTISRMAIALTTAQKLPPACGATAWASPLPILRDLHSKDPYRIKTKHNLDLWSYCDFLYMHIKQKT